jgi:hypothetical protein
MPRTLVGAVPLSSGLSSCFLDFHICAYCTYAQFLDPWSSRRLDARTSVAAVGLSRSFVSCFLLCHMSADFAHDRFLDCSSQRLLVGMEASLCSVHHSRPHSTRRAETRIRPIPSTRGLVLRDGPMPLFCLATRPGSVSRIVGLLQRGRRCCWC